MQGGHKPSPHALEVHDDRQREVLAEDRCHAAPRLLAVARRDVPIHDGNAGERMLDQQAEGDEQHVIREALGLRARAGRAQRTSRATSGSFRRATATSTSSSDEAGAPSRFRRGAA
jgi:hypothetical protein